MKLFLTPNPNHPYEKHHWLEKIPLDPVNRVDFGIELIMELEIDGKFNGKSIYPRKSNWRLAYKKDDGLVFVDKKPYHRRPKMYDVVFEPISSRQVRSVIKTILPIPPNPDIIIEVIDKDEKAKRK